MILSMGFSLMARVSYGRNAKMSFCGISAGSCHNETRDTLTLRVSSWQLCPSQPLITARLSLFYSGTVSREKVNTKDPF